MDTRSGEIFRLDDPMDGEKRLRMEDARARGELVPVSDMSMPPMKTLSKVSATARLLVRAAGDVRDGAQRVGRGAPGDWHAELAIGGLPDARREELLDRLVARPEAHRAAPIGDGMLRASGRTGGFSLAVACGGALGTFSQHLRDAGLTVEELLDANVTLKLTPVPRVELKQAGTAQAFLGRAHYGLNLAAADMFDIGARQRHGDRRYAVAGVLRDLDEASARKVNVLLAQIASPGGVNGDGNVHLDVSVHSVGTALGALLLANQKLADILEIMPAGSSLELSASPAAS